VPIDAQPPQRWHPYGASPLVITFVDRRSHRRLVNHTALFAMLEAQQAPRCLEIRFVDLAVLPFADQVREACEAGILVGVHGAGLTHSMVLRERAVVVEIQPDGLNHIAFRNLAAMRQLGYYLGYVVSVPKEEETTLGGAEVRRVARQGLWHWDDAEVLPEIFLGLMSAAIDSFYV
jgi:EGF domain-specific O-GlcNAc transferase